MDTTNPRENIKYGILLLKLSRYSNITTTIIPAIIETIVIPNISKELCSIVFTPLLISYNKYKTIKTVFQVLLLHVLNYCYNYYLPSSHSISCWR